MSPLRALAGGFAFLAVSVTPSIFRIDVKGGGFYWASARPSERSGRYVFRTASGTLMSIRKSDVAGIRAATIPARPDDTRDLGPTSPAAAARNQKLNAEELRSARPAKVRSLFRQDPYRPGIGIAYPPSPNDYKVGKTFAFPSSGKVYEGPPPTNVPEGPPPALEPPPPPPPKR
ncbi:MAG: hypothetical protein ACRD16_13485 [Thermoanaerobaculia bacterium]